MRATHFPLREPISRQRAIAIGARSEKNWNGSSFDEPASKFSLFHLELARFFIGLISAVVVDIP